MSKKDENITYSYEQFKARFVQLLPNDFPLNLLNDKKYESKLKEIYRIKIEEISSENKIFETAAQILIKNDVSKKEIIVVQQAIKKGDISIIDDFYEDYEKLLDSKIKFLVLNYCERATYAAHIGIYFKSEKLFLEAIRLQEKYNNNDSIGQSSLPYLGLGAVFYKQKRYADAEPIFLKGLEIDTYEFGESSLHALNIKHLLANCYQKTDRLRQAKTLKDECIQTLTEKDKLTEEEQSLLKSFQEIVIETT